jgi:hypothetical protein
MVIGDYTFGRMNINGRVYTADLMILPDGQVLADWRRRRGHEVGAPDLGPILSSRPELLIIGTGAYGRMRTDSSLEAELGAAGIRLVAVPTGDAVARFNQLQTACSRAAAFHLTC